MLSSVLVPHKLAKLFEESEKAVVSSSASRPQLAEVWQVFVLFSELRDALHGFAELTHVEKARRQTWLAMALRARFALNRELDTLASFMEMQDEGGRRWEERFAPTHAWVVTHEVEDTTLVACGVERRDYDALTRGQAAEATLVIAGCLPVDDGEDGEAQVYTEAVLEVRMGLGHLTFACWTGLDKVKECFERLVGDDASRAHPSADAEQMMDMVMNLDGCNVQEQRWFPMLNHLLAQLFVRAEDREREGVREMMVRSDPVRLVGERAARFLLQVLKGDARDRLAIPLLPTDEVRKKRLFVLHRELRAGGGAARLERALRRLDEDPVFDVADALEMKNVQGETPLYVAAQLGNVDALHVLVRRGADVNAQSHAGWTPLMSASARGAIGAVTLLLKAGADETVRDPKSKMTARAWALKMGNVEVANMLGEEEEEEEEADGWVMVKDPKLEDEEFVFVFMPGKGVVEMHVSLDGTMRDVGSMRQGTVMDRKYEASEQSLAEVVPKVTMGGGVERRVRDWTEEEVRGWLEAMRWCDDTAVVALRGVNGEELLGVSAERLHEAGVKRMVAQRVVKAVQKRVEKEEMEKMVHEAMGKHVEVQVGKVELKQLQPPDMSCVADGQFGAVYHGVFVDETGGERDVALKKPKGEASELCMRAGERTEIMCLAMAGSHPNVVELVGVCEAVPGAPGPCPVIRWHENGDLKAYLGAKETQLSAADMVGLMQGIVAGVAHLHEVGLVHGDLALENVVVTSKGVPRVSDLGVARSVDGKWPDGTLLRMRRMPPELLFGGEFGQAGDVWMLGLLLADVVRRREVDPFAGGREQIRRELEKDGGIDVAGRVQVEEAVGRVFGDQGGALVEVLRKCLAFEAGKRYRCAREVREALDEGCCIEV